MVAHLKVIAEPNLQTLLRVQVVALVQLNLRHKQVAVRLRGVNIVQNVLQRTDR